MPVPGVVEQTVAVPAETVAERVERVVERVAEVGASYLESSRSLSS